MGGPEGQRIHAMSNVNRKEFYRDLRENLKQGDLREEMRTRLDGLPEADIRRITNFVNNEWMDKLKNRGVNAWRAYTNRRALDATDTSSGHQPATAPHSIAANPNPAPTVARGPETPGRATPVTSAATPAVVHTPVARGPQTSGRAAVSTLTLGGATESARR